MSKSGHGSKEARTITIFAWFFLLGSFALLCLGCGGCGVATDNTQILGVVLLMASVVFGCWWLYRLRGFIWSVITQSFQGSRRYPLTATEWVLMILLSAGYSFLIGLIITVLGVMNQLPLIRNWMVTLAVATLVLLIFLLSLWAVFAKLSLKKNWDASGRRRWIAIFILLVVFVGTVAYFVNDAPPLASDYSEDDLVNPTKDAEASHNMLMTYKRGGSEKVTNTVSALWQKGFLTNAISYVDEIEAKWENIASARQVIDNLDSFDAVADLTPISFDAEMMSFVSYRNIARLYWEYTILKTQQGEYKEAATQLTRLYSAFHKTIPYSRSLVRRMICVAVMNGTIDVANYIVENSGGNRRVLKILEPVFVPLSPRDINPRYSFICEYLSIKMVCEELNLFQLCGIFSWDDSLRKPSRSQKLFSSIALPIVFNRNHTIRKLRSFFDPIINKAWESAPLLSDISDDADTVLQERSLKNLGGRSIIAIAVPSFMKCENSIVKLKVRSELLAIEISHHFGKDLNLKDYYTGKDYFKNEETGLLCSAGDDKLPSTEDDISLNTDSVLDLAK